MHDHPDDSRTPGHGHSLAEDLTLMAAMIARRRALKWFAGAGTAALVAGCGGSGSGSTGSVAVVSGTATATPTPTPTATPTSTPTAVSTVSGCMPTRPRRRGPTPPTARTRQAARPATP